MDELFMMKRLRDYKLNASENFTDIELSKEKIEIPKEIIENFSLTVYKIYYNPTRMIK